MSVIKNAACAAALIMAATAAQADYVPKETISATIDSYYINDYYDGILSLDLNLTVIKDGETFVFESVPFDLVIEQQKLPTWIMNINTGKIHTDSCSYAPSGDNAYIFTMSEEELFNTYNSFCKHCINH